MFIMLQKKKHSNTEDYSFKQIIKKKSKVLSLQNTTIETEKNGF